MGRERRRGGREGDRDTEAERERKREEEGERGRGKGPEVSVRWNLSACRPSLPQGFVLWSHWQVPGGRVFGSRFRNCLLQGKAETRGHTGSKAPAVSGLGKVDGQ